MFELKIESRTQTGKNANRRLRKEGKVPAVLYSKGNESQNITVSVNEWLMANKESRPEQVVLVDGDKKITAFVKEVQVDYLRDVQVHIDFQTAE
ncbi:hypothetical protein AAEX28_03850 [Lentisphaerota bacterium WC36G]|nr:hypothetical protein LJT99_06725 [Lentisphaerae bacterium WC36]